LGIGILGPKRCYFFCKILHRKNSFFPQGSAQKIFDGDYSLMKHLKKNTRKKCGNREKEIKKN
jgi:hypothetical protein